MKSRYQQSSRRWRHMLWIVPVCVLIGIYATDALAAARGIYTQLQILTSVIRLAREVYVDQVDTEKLMDGAIDGLLDELDPHSNYMSPEEAQKLQQKIQGEFGGVGITYSIIDGAPTVISTIEDGPAARAGLITGDRIIVVDGHTTLDWRNAEVQQHLRGEIGTKVKVTVRRSGEDTPVEIEILRGTIPLASVPYAFMVDDSTGYMRISNFARTTGREVGEALHGLLDQEMRYLVLDLRDNGGGDLDAAVEVANYILPEGSVVVTQRGRWQAANQTHYATAGPLKLTIPIVVMINHGSASASEIVSGALQDTDRAIIVGRRSFGKGLVQRPFDLSRRARGGGVLLLTVARYYTPTGRLIQRDYSGGTAQYLVDGLADSAASDSAMGPAYHTPLGRIVYGGGGILPDYSIPRGQMSRVVARLVQRAVFFRFADELVQQGETFPSSLDAFQEQFTLDEETWDAFIGFACKVDTRITDEEVRLARPELRPFIFAGIAGRMWGREARYRLLAPSDPELTMARRHLPDATHLLEAGAALRGR